ncbi:hypothetical protein K431DRAFT_216921 [Polychaeton citri CBS 116435]|uniref:Urease accessory protein UreD n=1 Tax=Polychaeton citri CBS 116435 TaxID=1314669 RepID=A0A9P4US50_9PEZI|nr:hypothetical protein K431DRAFT_216921 [Polychaeton citri CBS 116435]
MPHKHKRKTINDDGQFNLPPTSRAKALPSFHQDAKQQTRGKGKQQGPPAKTLKRKREVHADYKEDDTPKAFARLMQLQQTGKRFKSGLDDGGRKGEAAKKKQKNEPTAKDESTATKRDSTAEVPKILPGERLSDYAARVNRALPVSGLTRKGTQHIEGLKERRTKTEKRLHKMYAEWRETDAKRKAAEEEFAEQQEEEEEERAAALGVESLEIPTEGKRGRRKRMLTETNEVEEDPWAALKEKRGKASTGLHDVAQAPPELKKVREKFKVKKTAGAGVDVMNVPKTAGSLKKREELSSARMEIIERYRAMMKSSGS